MKKKQKKNQMIIFSVKNKRKTADFKISKTFKDFKRSKVRNLVISPLNLAQKESPANAALIHTIFPQIGE